jgi:hypothetical protein
MGHLGRRFVGGLILVVACSSTDSGGSGRDASFAPPPERVVVDATGPIGGGGQGDGGVGAACDLLMPECPAELACYRSGCAVPGASVAGAVCGRDSDCRRGLVCAGAPGDQRCRALCRVSDGEPCARCQSLLPDKDLGYCP